MSQGSGVEWSEWSWSSSFPEMSYQLFQQMAKCSGVTINVYRDIDQCARPLSGYLGTFRQVECIRLDLQEYQLAICRANAGHCGEPFLIDFNNTQRIAFTILIQITPTPMLSFT